MTASRESRRRADGAALPGRARKQALAVTLFTAGCAAWAPAPAAQAAAAPAGTAAPAAAADPRFDLLEFEVEGNTVLAPLVVEQALLPFMGQGRTIADVEQARAALEQAYQGAGWLTVFVDVPEQRVDSGVVRLNVTEGRVDRLRVTGSRYFSQGWIRATVPELQAGEVPNFNVVQRQIAELNRGVARQVQPVLRPGRVPGTVEAELKVVDQLPLAGGIELRSYESPGAEPWRLSANLRWDNLFQRDHSASLTLATVPRNPKESRVLVASWGVPGQGDASWLTTLVLSDSELAPLGAATVLGRNVQLGLRWVRPVFGPDGSHTFSVGADFKDLQERFLTGGDEISTPLRYLPFSLGHTGSWVHGRGAAASSTSLATSFLFGSSRLLRREISCPDTNVGRLDQFACRRQGADGGFGVLRSELRHTRPLFNGQLALRLGGQIASQPLVGGEQLTVGGADSVRGFGEAEAAGDHALLGSAEWRSPNLWPRPEGENAAAAGELVLLGFIDLARTYLIDVLPGQNPRASLLGSGLGLRLRLGRAYSAAVDVGWPHKPARDNPERDPRWNARFGAQF